MIDFNRIRLITLVALICLPLAPYLSASPESPETQWRHFRTQYPYHIQTLAISPPDSNGHRTLLITEPPPQLQVSQLLDVDPLSLQDSIVKTKEVGADGWVKDVVVDLPSMSDAALAQLLDSLHLRLFGTTYKAYAIDVSSSPSPAVSDLNLRVTSAQLGSWLLGPLATDSSKHPEGVSIYFALCIVTLLLWRVVPSLRRAPGMRAGLYILLLGCILLWFFGWLALLGSTLGFAILAAFKVAAKQFRPALALGFASVFLAGLIALHYSRRSADTALQPVMGGPSVSCQDVLERKLSGVFVSRKPGLVIWALPRRDDLQKHLVEARQFALDSDLLLGAVASETHIAIVGRERVTAVSLLPPLRTETLMLLAAAKEDELGQSFERKNPFAGRFDEELNKDWAPIFLSPRLIDTEYGSLLNITDQMLKSWSMSGKVRYANFEYPNPSTFPFPGGLRTKLGNPNEIVFNWNTKGAGYVSKVGGFELFALNKTGALPIDYLSAGKPAVQSAEDIAYDYYGKLNDPNLVRVVEYAGFYQLFHYFGIQTEHSEQPPDTNSQTDYLAGEARRLLGRMRLIPDAFLESIATTSTAEERNTIESMRKFRDALQEINRLDSDHSFQDNIARAMVDRTTLIRLNNSDHEGDKAIASLAETANELSSEGFGRSEGSLAQTILMFTLASERSHNSWIRTPSVVISTGDKSSVGGHNLYSHVLVYRADPALEIGKVAVEDVGTQRIIHFNPSDESRIAMTVRDAARHDDTSAKLVEMDINDRLPKIKVELPPLEKALGFRENERPDPLRGFQPVHGKSTVSQMGWEPAHVSLPEADIQLLSELGRRNSSGILIERGNDGQIFMHSATGMQLKASDLASATDGFLNIAKGSGEQSVNVHFRGFEGRQAEGFLRSAKFQSEDARVFVASLDENITPQELRGLERGEYRLGEAKIVDDPQITEDKEHVTAKVSVPHVDAAKPSLLVRITLRLSKTFVATAEFLGTLRLQLQEIFATLRGEQDLRFATAELFSRLKKDHRFSDVNIQVIEDGRDVFHARCPAPVQGNKGEYLPA